MRALRPSDRDPQRVPLLLLVLLTLQTPFIGASCPTHICMDDYHSATARGIVPERSQRYCELVVDTIRCLDELKLRCTGAEIHLPATRSGLTLQRKMFDCDNFQISRYSQRNQCPWWPQETTPARVCALFGYPHVRTFEGRLETCSTLFGAYPLLENPFFLVQVSIALVDRTPAVTKITLLVKSVEGCTKQNVYEASRDEERLGNAFADGAVGDNETIRIQRHSHAHVQIDLLYIRTTVHFRRQGPYLGVSIRIPDRLFDMLSQENVQGQSCLHGCSAGALLPLPEVLAAPTAFISQCTTLSQPLVPPTLAHSHCQHLLVSEDFLSACVFDQLVGGHKLSNLTQLVQHDVRHLLTIRSSANALTRVFEEPVGTPNPDPDHPPLFHCHRPQPSHALRPTPVSLVLVLVLVMLGCLHLS